MRLSFKIVLLVSLAFIKILSQTNAANPTPTESFPGNVILQGPDLIYLYWRHDNNDITFQLQYKNTSKWIMFGINQANSGYSDLIAGWINNDGIGHFSDRKSTDPNVIPAIDANQDWFIQNATVINDYRILKFTRKIRLCDTTSNDLDIMTGIQNRIVYAIGNQTNDNNGAILDFRSLSTYPSLNLLSQTTGPFNCQTRQSPPQFTSQPTGQYTNQVDLVEGVFRFYWNFTSTDLIGEVHCKTTGWVGFGLSPNGGMDQSDVFIGWISNGVANFTDRYIRGRQVLIDKNQDWKLLFSAERDGYTIFKFTRKLLLCDSEDRKIESGSPRMIFAYGPSDPAPGQDIGYHGTSTRGSQAVNLISSSASKAQDIKDLEILEFGISHVILPARDTFYYVNLFEIPKNLTQKRHIIKWEIVLPTINRNSIHHLLIYECQPSYNGTPAVPPGDVETNPFKGQFCNSITHGWAVGGDLFTYYPKDMGYPIGGDTDYSYVVPEIHYDNPDLKIGYIEFVKIRYYMTKTLQKNELGVLTIGSETNVFALELPPGLDNIGITTYCPKSCTSKMLKDTDITIISSIPHTHLAGNEVWTKIIRNGRDIGYLFNNKYYDFNYQESYLLDPPITITKNDELITQCNYQTKNRTKFTRAGLSTKDEMCYQFMGYYPRRANFKGCTSLPTFRSIVELMLSLNSTKDAFVPAFNYSSFEGIYRAYYEEMLPRLTTFTDGLKKKYIDFYKTNKFYSFCSSDLDFTTEHDPIRASNIYIEPDTCKKSDGSLIVNNAPGSSFESTKALFMFSSFIASLFLCLF